MNRLNRWIQCSNCYNRYLNFRCLPRMGRARKTWAGACWCCIIPKKNTSCMQYWGCSSLLLMLKDATTFLGCSHLAIRTFLIFLTFFTTCHIPCMCNLTRLKVKPLRAMRQKQKTLTKQTMASNLFPVWQRPLQRHHADSLSLFLSRDIS